MELQNDRILESSIIQNLNNMSDLINESPIVTKKCIRSKKYQKEKIQSITNSLQRILIKEEIINDDSIQNKCRYFDEMLTQIKEAFNAIDESDKKNQILTLLPK